MSIRKDILTQFFEGTQSHNIANEPEKEIISEGVTTAKHRMSIKDVDTQK